MLRLRQPETLKLHWSRYHQLQVLCMALKHTILALGQTIQIIDAIVRTKPSIVTIECLVVYKRASTAAVS